MNRRRFLKLLGLAPVAPVAYSFLGSGIWTPPPPGLLGRTNLTLAEWAKFHQDSGVDRVVNLLVQQNKILEDVVFKGAGPFHRWENPNEDEIYSRWTWTDADS